MIDPLKIKAMVEFLMPTLVTNVYAFLGLNSYYQNHIKGYVKIDVPLFELTEKDVHFQWVFIYQGTFETLKRVLMETPILFWPDFNKAFILNVD